MTIDRTALRALAQKAREDAKLVDQSVGDVRASQRRGPGNGVASTSASGQSQSRVSTISSRTFEFSSDCCRGTCTRPERERRRGTTSGYPDFESTMGAVPVAPCTVYCAPLRAPFSAATAT